MCLFALAQSDDSQKFINDQLDLAIKHILKNNYVKYFHLLECVKMGTKQYLGYKKFTLQILVSEDRLTKKIQPYLTIALNNCRKWSV